MIMGIDGVVFWGMVLFAVCLVFAVSTFREDMLP